MRGARPALLILLLAAGPSAGEVAAAPSPDADAALVAAGAPVPRGRFEPIPLRTADAHPLDRQEFPTFPADVDGDGDEDIFTLQAHDEGTGPEIFFGLREGSGGAMVWREDAPDGNSFLVPGDFDGDGVLDLLVVSEGSSLRVSMRSLADGSTRWSKEIAPRRDGLVVAGVGTRQTDDEVEGTDDIRDPYIDFAFDADGDGGLDVLLTTIARDETRLGPAWSPHRSWIQRSTIYNGATGAPISTIVRSDSVDCAPLEPCEPPADPPDDFLLAPDLDGDGEGQVLEARYGAPGTLRALGLDGETQLWSRSIEAETGLSWWDSRDLDADGTPDLLMRPERADGSQPLVAIDGASGATMWTSEAWFWSAIGDVNGDGSDDYFELDSLPDAAAVRLVSGRTGSAIWSRVLAGAPDLGEEALLGPCCYDALDFSFGDATGDGIGDPVVSEWDVVANTIFGRRVFALDGASGAPLWTSARAGYYGGQVAPVQRDLDGVSGVDAARLTPAMGPSTFSSTAQALRGSDASVSWSIPFIDVGTAGAFVDPQWIMGASTAASSQFVFVVERDHPNGATTTRLFAVDSAGVRWARDPFD